MIEEPIVPIYHLNVVSGNLEKPLNLVAQIFIESGLQELNFVYGAGVWGAANDLQGTLWAIL